MNLSTNQQNYLYNDLRVTFYQCDFNKLIAQVHEFITDETNVDLISKAIHLKAKALFELEHRNKALEVLNEREKEIITLRKLREKPLKLEELSAKFNISRERVRQIEEKALEKLQKEVSNIS